MHQKDDKVAKEIEKLKKEEEKKKHEFSEFENKNQQLQQENEQLKNQLLRTAADLQNFRRRTEEGKRELLDAMTAATITEFLPVIDNLERSFDHLPENLKSEDWVKGVKHILDQCHTVLQKHGVKPLETKKGDAVNPAFHTVVAKGEGENGKITEIIEKGYAIGDKVIRTAKVKVG